MLTAIKPRKCSQCPKEFIPFQSLQEVCSVRCATRKAKNMRAAKVKDEKESFKKRKAAITPISKLENDCRRIVQKIARIRDRNDPCISCDKPASWDGQWHGSHFRSHGACSALQFHLWNINKSCWICNKLYSGRIDQYEPRLVKKIGQEKVDWLHAQNGIVKRSREYLTRFKKVMGKRLRRMEKQVEREDEPCKT